MHGYSFGNLCKKTSQSTFSKQRLGGEVCSSDVNMHKGHVVTMSAKQTFFVLAGGINHTFLH